MDQLGAFPTNNPGYSSQYTPPPPRKTHRGLIAIIIVLIVALVAVTGLLFAVGSNRLAGVFGTPNTPIVQATPTTPPVPTATSNNTTPQATATTPPTQQTTPTTVSTQQAQATIQQYYNDINNQDYQDAYNLWVNNPETYANFKQGFAHTHHDAITLRDATVQVDGTIQVNLTVQATEDASGGGTQISTFTGYYTVGQQADGSWKIINGQLG
jgi:flagellar basal body-associated protein FliL